MLKHYTIRLSDETVKQISEIAIKKHLPIRTMVQSWILERIVDENTTTDYTKFVSEKLEMENG